MSFQAFQYPRPNMLVQEGTHVIVHGLKSETGKLLNGKGGVAEQFNPQNGRWVVRMDEDEEEDVGEDGEKQKQEGQNHPPPTSTAAAAAAAAAKPQTKNQIKIQNLMVEGSIRVCSGGGFLSPTHDVAAAGTIGNNLTIGIYGDPTREGFDFHALEEKLLMMGTPPKFIEGLVEQLKSRKQKKEEANE